MDFVIEGLRRFPLPLLQDMEGLRFSCTKALNTAFFAVVETRYVLLHSPQVGSTANSWDPGPAWSREEYSTQFVYWGTLGKGLEEKRGMGRHRERRILRRDGGTRFLVNSGTFPRQGAGTPGSQE